MTVIEGAEQYFWQDGKKGVLLIHGYTGSPAELKLLGEYLNKMDKLISVVYIIYVLLFIFIIVMMKLNYGR